MPRQLKVAAPADPSTVEPKVCKACLHQRAKGRGQHWFYSFSTNEALFEHLASYGISTTEAYREQLAAWRDRCHEYVKARELEPARWCPETEHIRQWSMHASECQTPDEMDSLAAKLLTPGAAIAVRRVTALWRKYPEGRPGIADQLLEALDVKDVPAVKIEQEEWWQR